MSNLNNNGLFSGLKEQYGASCDPSGFPSACSGYIDLSQNNWLHQASASALQRCEYCGSMGYLGKCASCGADIVPKRKSFYV